MGGNTDVAILSDFFSINGLVEIEHFSVIIQVDQDKDSPSRPE